MTRDKTDPVITLLEKIAREVGEIDDDYSTYDIVVRISSRRNGDPATPTTPDIFSFIEALAEKAAKDAARQECIKAKIKYFESRRKMYLTAQNPEMAKACEIVAAVLGGILPETNPNVEQNEKALLEYLEKETAKAIEQTQKSI